MSSFPFIGIMQGRLSKSLGARIQFFPKETWEKEFILARQLGFDLIEFIFDGEDYQNHPLLHPKGLEKIQNSIQKTGVQVLSVCADFFMSHSLHSGTSQDQDLNFSILQQLISQCQKLGVQDIVLPCVDQSSLRSEDEKTLLKKRLKKIHPLLKKTGIHLALECDLNPISFKNFLEGLDLSHITVNYDIGNSASLGYDVTQELEAYGSFISSVHIKDRILHGTTVALGTGASDFSTFFSQLKKIGYSGSFIIQGARGDNELRVASSQLQFVKKLIEKHLSQNGSST